MNILPILCLLSLLACYIYLYVGIYIYRFSSKSDLSLITFILCINMALWSFSCAFIYITADNNRFIWRIISSLGNCYVYAIAFHLLMLFISNNNIKKPIFRILIYIPGSVLFIIKVFSFRFNIAKDVYDYGIFIYSLVYFLISFALLYRKLKITNILRYKKQYKIIIITGTISYLLMQVSRLYSLIYKMPNIEQLFNVILVIGIFYTNIKYGIFEISRKRIIDEVLSVMMDIVVIISPKGKVIKVNNRMKYLTGYTSGDLFNMHFNVFLEDNGLIDRIIKENNNFNIRKSAQLRGKSILNCITRYGEKIPIESSYSVIIDSNLNKLLGIIIVGHDLRETQRLQHEILEHRKSERQLRESEKRFRLMFYENKAIMYLVDPKTFAISDMNKSAMEFYGYPESKVKKMHITDLNGLSYDKTREILSQIMSKNKNSHCFKHKLYNGEIKDVEVYSTLIPIENKNMLFSIVIDITERKKAEEWISFLAYHDPLTGLPNRKLFHEELEKEIKLSKINNRGFTILYIDIDNFKFVNDNFGHATGDFILCEVGMRIKSCINKNDILARVGGDEFILLAPGVQKDEDVNLLVEKILNVFNTPIAKDKNKIFTQVSIGVSIYPKHGKDINDLLKIADLNMYKQKRNKV